MFQLLPTPTHVAVFTAPTREKAEVISADVVGYEKRDHPIYLPSPFEEWRQIGDRVEVGSHGWLGEIIREGENLGSYWVRHIHEDGCEHTDRVDVDSLFAIHDMVQGESGGVTEYEPLVNLNHELGIRSIAGLWTATQQYADAYTFTGDGVVGMYVGIFRPDLVQKAISDFRAKMPTQEQREARDVGLVGVS